MCDRQKMLGKHFNELEIVADEKTSLIKMDLGILISNVAFVLVNVTIPKNLCSAVVTQVGRSCMISY